MLQIKNLTATHKKDLRVLFEDFSFSLESGDKIAIIGEEGNGKSTLLKLIYDAALVEDYIEYSGEIIKNNAVIGYLPQELPEEEAETTVSDFIAGFSGFEPKELAEAASLLGLNLCALSSEQMLGSLSGGEKIKLQLMRILAKHPDLLLLDEPSNDIDIDTLEWLEGFIRSCEAAVLFISHDETLLENTAGGIIHIEQLRKKSAARCTVARMSYSSYITERGARFAHQKQMAKSEQREYDKQMEKYRKIEAKVEHRQETISRADPQGGRLLKKKMKAVKSMGRRFEKEHEGRARPPEYEEAVFLSFCSDGIPRGKTVLDLDIKRLSIGDRLLSEDVRLFVAGGEKICIVGKNGVGKTTLLRIIARELLPRQDFKAVYMPQNYAEILKVKSTPIDFLSLNGDKDEKTRIRTYLGSLKYTAKEMERPLSALSGGQRAKLFFAKMALWGYDLLILDEPTRNLSPLSGPAVREVLKGFKGSIISVSHDRKYIKEVCDRVYELTTAGLRQYKT